MKIKPLTKEQLIISIDRLTRFKDTETKYLRVFKDIITNNLIEPKYKKSDLDALDYETIKNYAVEIINSSLEKSAGNYLINQRLYDYENSVFKLDENTLSLLKNKINYEAVIKLLPENIPDNLKWLKSLNDTRPQNSSYGFPVKKILLCEGITEETLLPVFAKICGCNFKEQGVYIISAGGKNQVVKYFYNFANSLKIPVFILLDNDAEENLREIEPKLRSFDKIHLLKSGEFEDLLPNSLITKTLNYATKNISLAPIENLEQSSSKVEFLEEFFRHRGLHEFKKAEFAELVKENISSLEDVSDEIKEIIKELSADNKKEASASL
ncbi:recF/RecN/SMC N terminal domain-containing protein [Clostridium sp. CAG:967]|nr:recF/RecN/SMC N terminal domain-containing protein [Clostridium sp. CAG:967]